MSFAEQVRQYARHMIPGVPPVPVAHPEVGLIGWAERRYAACELPFRRDPKTMRESTLRALVRDDDRFRRLEYERVRKHLLRERGAVTTWDGVLNARANGNA